MDDRNVKFSVFHILEVTKKSFRVDDEIFSFFNVRTGRLKYRRARKFGVVTVFHPVPDLKKARGAADLPFIVIDFLHRQINSLFVQGVKVGNEPAIVLDGIGSRYHFREGKDNFLFGHFWSS